MKKIKINKEYCIGCSLCLVACAVNSSKSKNIVKAYKEEKVLPKNNFTEADAISFPVICRHCEDASCMKACITGAITKNDAGYVTINSDKCVGCYSCVMVCPNNAIKSYRTLEGKKIALKCDLCNGEDPACVKACPNKAIVVIEE
jgi:anaerobic carbon-monoxide dehydrogenase iron sulfur subunit